MANRTRNTSSSKTPAASAKKGTGSGSAPLGAGSKAVYPLTAVCGSAIERVLFESHLTVPQGYRYFPDSVLISRRFMTRYVDELLVQGKINVEFIARECAQRDVRGTVSRALATDALGKAFLNLHSHPIVDLDVAVHSKGSIYDAVLTVLGANAPAAARAATVLTEVMLFVLHPLGIIDSVERGFAHVAESMEFFPKYDDLVVDIWAREIEKTLSETNRLDIGTAKKKIGTSVVANRLAAVARDLRDCIEYVGDYATYASDAMVLVRAHLLPRESRDPSVPFYPSELVDHPVIKALAANLTIANIALKRQGPQTMSSTQFLIERLPQVAAFFFESKRYIKVSLSDFRNHFTKSSYRTLIDNKLIGGALSYNLRGAPAAQAITESQSLLITGAKRVKVRDNATKAASALYGNVMAVLDTASVHRTYKLLHDNLYLLEVLPADDPYLDLILPEELKESSSDLIEALAVAVAVCGDGEVSICERGGLEDEAQRLNMGETEFAFVYSLPTGENYLPSSGIRNHDRFDLLCPAEAIFVAMAWEGPTYLADKAQILPESVLGDRIAILGSPDFNLAPARGYARMDLTVNDSVKLVGGFQFIGGSIRKTERDAEMVRPLLNHAVVRTAFAVFADLLARVDSSVNSQALRVQMKRYVMAHIYRAVGEGVGSAALSPYVEAVRRQCMTNIKREAGETGVTSDSTLMRDIRRLEALLSEGAVERCIEMFVFEQVLQVLNLLPSEAVADDGTRKSVVFDALQSDRDFSMLVIASNN